MKTGVSTVVAAIRSYHERLQGTTLSPMFKQVLVASGPLISTISLGMTSGYSAILLPQLQATNSSIYIDQDEASWIASMAVLPMAFGCLLGGFLMDLLGRKTTQMITTLPCIIGWLLISVSPNTPTILTGRFLTGLSGGLLGPSTGVYISETSEPRYRGFLLGAISLSVALGLLFVHSLGTLLDWKTTAIISSTLPVLSFFLLSLVPESPSWLAKKNRIEDAEKAFFWCRGETEDSKKELSGLFDRETVKGKEFFKPLIVIVVFIVVNQWAGVNALTFYTVSIMKKTVGHNLNEYLAMLLIDFVRVVMSIATCFIMKRFGRRPLALVSGFGTFSSLFVLSGFTYFAKIYPDLGALWYSVIPMSSLISYIIFISVGFVPLPWAMMSEVFPLNRRNVGSSVSSFMGFAAFFSVVKTSHAMFDGLGTAGTFFIYGMVAFAGTIINWFFLPETKDKTLNEIEDDLKK